MDVYCRAEGRSGANLEIAFKRLLDDLAALVREMEARLAAQMCSSDHPIEDWVTRVEVLRNGFCSLYDEIAALPSAVKTADGVARLFPLFDSAAIRWARCEQLLDVFRGGGSLADPAPPEARACLAELSVEADKPVALEALFEALRANLLRGQQHDWGAGKIPERFWDRLRIEIAVNTKRLEREYEYEGCPEIEVSHRAVSPRRRVHDLSCSPRTGQRSMNLLPLGRLPVFRSGAALVFEVG